VFFFKLWSVCSKDNSIIKYNLATMATQKYDVNEDINLLISSTCSDYTASCCITDIKIFDGIVWLCVSVTKVIWVDVSSPPTCKVLGSMMCPSEPVKTTQVRIMCNITIIIQYRMLQRKTMSYFLLIRDSRRTKIQYANIIKSLIFTILVAQRNLILLEYTFFAHNEL
jgi:hypothetical protein